MMIQNYLWVHFVSNYKETASIAIELNMTFWNVNTDIECFSFKMYSSNL